jgi:hypothetical protein
MADSDAEEEKEEKSVEDRLNALPLAELQGLCRALGLTDDPAEQAPAKKIKTAEAVEEEGEEDRTDRVVPQRCLSRACMFLFWSLPCLVLLSRAHHPQEANT